MTNSQQILEEGLKRDTEEKLRMDFEEFAAFHDEDCPVNDEDGQDPCECICMKELTDVAMKHLTTIYNRGVEAGREEAVEHIGNSLLDIMIRGARHQDVSIIFQEIREVLESARKGSEV